MSEIKPVHRYSGQVLTVERVRAAIDAAMAHALKLGLRATVAITDAGGHLLALTRMDGAALVTVEVSQVKAKTAVMFGVSTRKLPFDQPFVPALLGAMCGPAAFVAGGQPIEEDGVIIGAIGVSGGTSEQDEQCAAAGVAAARAS